MVDFYTYLGWKPCTATATHGCAVSAKSRSNACWPPPRRTSRKSPCCSLQPTRIRRRKPDLRCWPPKSKHSNKASPPPPGSAHKPNSRTKQNPTENDGVRQQPGRPRSLAALCYLKRQQLH